jgi:hypothetical protein
MKTHKVKDLIVVDYKAFKIKKYTFKNQNKLNWGGNAT